MMPQLQLLLLTIATFGAGGYMGWMVWGWKERRRLKTAQGEGGHGPMIASSDG